MVGGSLASSTTKTGRNDIGEILLKVALSTKKSIKSIIYHETPTKTICFTAKFITVSMII